MEIKQEIAQVQKRPETFADIRKETEARFRELVEAWMQRRSTFQTTLGAMQAFNKLFDRLEAAHKREKAEWVNANAGLAKLVDIEKVGNSAAMREALIDVVKRLEAYVGCDHHTFHPTATTCDGITSVGKCGKIGTCAAIFKARSALAAPARNCERFANAGEAWDAYDEWVESYRSKGKIEPFNEFGWLYAEAKEGGRS